MHDYIKHQSVSYLNLIYFSVFSGTVCCVVLLTIEGLSLAPRGKHVDTYRGMRRGSNILHNLLIQNYFNYTR